MTEAGAPRRSTAVYNPRLLAKDELVATFAARQPVLDSLVDDLRRGAHQHFLIVGQRGAGKTTLLLRLAYAIEDDARLRGRALALTFPEEQYNVHRVSDLWLNCVDALIDALERAGDQAAVKRLEAEVARIEDEEPDEEERTQRGFALLTGWAKKAHRDLVLLIDNLDIVLDRLGAWHWALRDTLSEDNRLIVVGGSSTHVQETFTYQSPFYDFFKVHELGALDVGEARAMLLRLADATEAPRVKAALDEPGRFEALHLFSGGMPRTMVLLLRLLTSEGTTRAEEDLERLLDDVTPYYKARFEELPAQSQVIVDALALHYDPMTAAECAKKTGLEVTLVSAQLSRLVRQGVVSKLPSADSSKLSFLISERLFAIWYAMRTSRRLRRRLYGLIDAVKALYGVTAVQRRARALLSIGDDPARLLAYATHVEDPALRRGLEFRAAEEIMISRPARHLDEVLNVLGEDRHVAWTIGRIQAAAFMRGAIASSRLAWPSSSSAHQFAEALCAHPLLSLEHKLLIAENLAKHPPAEPVGDVRATNVEICHDEATWQVRFPHLSRSVATGEMAPLADVRDADDVKSMVASLSGRERVLAAVLLAEQLDPDGEGYRWLLESDPYIFFLELNRLATASPDHALRLLGSFKHLLSDAPAPVFQAASAWRTFARAGRGTEAASMILAAGREQTVAPLYEALRAAGEGRRGELVHLAPELRRPAEEILASWFPAEEPNPDGASAYVVPRGGASTAAEARPGRTQAARRGRKAKKRAR